jgi:hypothetical protein
MYSKEQIIPLAQKFLDRVEIKGLQEHFEFANLINFFSSIEKGDIEIHIKMKPEDNKND